MSTLNYGRFGRVLNRCQEIPSEPALPAILAQVYNASIAGPVTAFLAAATIYDDAVESLAQASRATEAALKGLDSPYRVARSSLAAVARTVNLPGTLKAQRTDTDALNAIQHVLSSLGEHSGNPWADTLLQGDFGTRAAAAIAAIKRAIAAGKALNKAQLDRAAAYEPAYEAYLAFKRVVRDALGANSKQYRRIHLRSTQSGTGEDNARTQEAPVVEPAPTAATAPADASAPVKAPIAEPGAAPITAPGAAAITAPGAAPIAVASSITDSVARPIAAPGATPTPGAAPIMASGAAPTPGAAPPHEKARVSTPARDPRRGLVPG